MITLSSGRITIQCVTSVGDAAARMRPSRARARESLTSNGEPPPIAEEALRNWRP
jgi:hypothetical protein